jgi:hypothetical protein
MFAPDALARKTRTDFPAKLTDAPVLLPSGGALHRDVERWLGMHQQTVQKLARVAHPELYAAAAGAAIFAPALLRGSLKKQYDLLPVGELQGSRWRLFVVTTGKGFRHPALDAVTRAAQALR